MKTIFFAKLPELIVKDFGASDWLEITQDRVNAFADATGDDQWIHIDVARATREIGGPIAHGYLISSLIPLLARSLFSIEGQARTLNYGVDRLRFTQPVQVGRRVRMRSRVLGTEPKAGGILARFAHTIEVDGEVKPACVAETLSLFLPA